MSGRKRRRPKKPAEPRVRGTATATLDVIKWIGWGFFVIGVLGTSAGLATIPFLGYAPENPWAEGSLNFLLPGLFVPFACAIAHGNLSSVWVTSDGNWLTTATPKQKLVRLAATIPFGAIALALLGMGAIPLLQFVPFEDNLGNIIGAALIGLLLFAVVASALAGGMVLLGWRGGIVGLVLGFGFITLVFGLVNSSTLWSTLGALGLALSIVGFYFIGATTGSLPTSFGRHYGTWIAVVTGIILIVWGAISGSFWTILVGVFTIAAWAGIRLAVRRVSKPAQNDGDLSVRSSVTTQHAETATPTETARHIQERDEN